MDLLDAVVVPVDVVVLCRKHVDHGVVLEVFDGPSIQVINLLQTQRTTPRDSKRQVS
jgi:hypothetical protein